MYDLATPGMLIAVEGIDAAGGSTLVANLTSLMNERGLKTFATKEPTDNLVGGLIRGFLTHEWDPSPRTRQQLFAADRSHHLDRVILPNLRQGHHVVTDRYFWSTFAFGMVDLEQLELMHYNDAYPWPDVTFFTDVPVEVTQARLGERDSLQLFEKKSTQERVRENYHELYRQFPKRITLLDGKLPREMLAEQAFKAIMAHPLIKDGFRVIEPSYLPNVPEDKKKLRHGWDEPGDKEKAH
jgi:dTMP kinase